MRLISRVFACLAVGLAFSTVRHLPALASPLEDILESPAINQLDRQNEHFRKKEKRLVQKTPLWIDKKTEYGQLFLAKKNRLNLISWLSSNLGRYQLGKISSEGTDQFISVEAKLMTDSKAAIFLRVLLPHPKFIEMTQFQLIKAFNNLTPQKEQLSYEEEIPFGRNRGTLYQLTTGECGLRIDAEKGAVIHLHSKNCKSMRDLVDIGKTLDLVRFNRKLNS